MNNFPTNFFFLQRSLILNHGFTRHVYYSLKTNKLTGQESSMKIRPYKKKLALDSSSFSKAGSGSSSVNR